MSPLNRREFLAGAGAAGVAGAALALGACSSDGQVDSGSSGTGSIPGTTPGSAPLPNPKDAPFDTVVVLMMENRSFDHFLGWLPGANGKQAGLSYADSTGKVYETAPLAPDWQGCELQDPFHTWQAMMAHWNNGACDGFLKTQPVGDHFPIGYYGASDLPILGALAQGYTCFDNYFASSLNPTWPNRLYQLCGQTDIDYTATTYPPPGGPFPVHIETSIYDIVQAAGLNAGNYVHGEPMTGIFASQRYNDITYNIDRFWSDAEAGKLPNVTFVDPDFTTHAEFNGTSNDFHPYGSIQVADGFVAQVHDALVKSPQWDRMVFVLNFDESGGFLDHVPPPPAPDQSVLNPADPMNDLASGGPNLKSLGFRVPCIMMSPWSPQRIDHSGPYEHCSVLSLIEWRFGLKPMTVRDAQANNLANALDFSIRRDPITLPSFTPTPATVCDNTKHFS